MVIGGMILVFLLYRWGNWSLWLLNYLYYKVNMVIKFLFSFDGFYLYKIFFKIKKFVLL